MTQETKEEPLRVARARCMAFWYLKVPERVPLVYEYEWMRRRLFEDTKKKSSEGLGDHVYAWFQDLEQKMKTLNAFINKNKGTFFKDDVCQFMYGSFLETMRDLLIKIIRATMGPRHHEYTIKEMNDRLAPFLQGVDGSGGYDFSKEQAKLERLEKDETSEAAK